MTEHNSSTPPLRIKTIPRLHNRYSVCLMARLFRKDRGLEQFLCECDIYNLSVKGCHFTSEIEVPSGKFVGMKLILPLEDDPLNINLSYVRWSKEVQGGLEFRILTTDAQERLHQYISTLHTQTEHTPFP